MLKYTTSCQIYTCQSQALFSVSKSRLEIPSAGYNVELHFISWKHRYPMDTADYVSQNQIYKLQSIGLHCKIATLYVFHTLFYAVT